MDQPNTVKDLQQENVDDIESESDQDDGIIEDLASFIPSTADIPELPSDSEHSEESEEEDEDPNVLLYATEAIREPTPPPPKKKRRKKKTVVIAPPTNYNLDQAQMKLKIDKLTARVLELEENKARKPKPRRKQRIPQQKIPPKVNTSPIFYNPTQIGMGTQMPLMRFGAF
jgi:hypothetical protein